MVKKLKDYNHYDRPQHESRKPVPDHIFYGCIAYDGQRNCNRRVGKQPKHMILKCTPFGGFTFEKQTGQGTAHANAMGATQNTKDEKR